MGYETEPVEPGDDALCCWPEGETPSAVVISYTELVTCGKLPGFIPQPFNGTMLLFQDPGDPAYFFREIVPWVYSWAPCMGDNQGMYQTWQIQDMFKGWQAGNCDTFFPNILNCADPLTAAQGGQGIVCWNISPADHSIGSLLHAINMEPHADTKFEVWPASEERMCVRFARKQDATNILILVEPTEL